MSVIVTYLLCTNAELIVPATVLSSSYSVFLVYSSLRSRKTENWMLSSLLLCMHSLTCPIASSHFSDAAFIILLVAVILLSMLFFHLIFASSNISHHFSQNVVTRNATASNPTFMVIVETNFPAAVTGY